MNKISLDTNLLIYAHNQHNPFHNSASDFMQRALKSEFGQLYIAIQIFVEFVNTITSNRVAKPLTLLQATHIIEYYLEQDITLLTYAPNHMQTWLELLKIQPSRKKLFDTSLASTLRSNNITTLYTANVKDFQSFDFLTVINPLV